MPALPTTLPPEPAAARPLRGGRTRWARALAATAALVALGGAGLLLTGCQGQRAVAPSAPLAGAPSAAPGDGDVALLRDPDFAQRAAATDRLVAAGTAALPALGARGDQPAPGLDGRPESTTGPVIAAILARPTDDEVARLLDAPHAVLRREAAHELGRRGAWTPIPQLIERLEDPAPAVQEAAHEALRRITGEVLATGSGRPGALSASLAERWRTWWREAGRARAQRHDGAPPG